MEFKRASLDIINKIVNIKKSFYDFYTQMDLTNRKIKEEGYNPIALQGKNRLEVIGGVGISGLLQREEAKLF